MTNGWKIAGLTSIGTFGSTILGSYYYLFKQKDRNEYWGQLKSKEWNFFPLWSTSALLTAISFIYVVVLLYWLIDEQNTTVFGLDFTDSSVYAILFIIFTLFLVSASLWVFFILKAKRNKDPTYSKLVSASLYTTAFASLSLLVFMSDTRNTKEHDIKLPLGTISSAIILYHTLFWDAQVWRNTWKY